jgi:hypothetical protein
VPSDIQIIDINGSAPFEAGAQFFARLAYPAPQERNRRDQLYSALVRWAILWKSDLDDNWSRETLSVRPIHLVPDEAVYEKAFTRGLQILEDRYLVVDHIVIPILKKAKKQPVPLIGNLPPTFSNLAATAMASLGWEGDSEKTFADDMWRPARPVVHAALSFMLFARKSVLVECMFDCMEDTTHLRAVVLASEILRLDISTADEFKKFKLRETQTTVDRSP